MSNLDDRREELLQAIVDVVPKLDSRGIPFRPPEFFDLPEIVQDIIGLPMGRVRITRSEAAKAAGGE